MVSWPSGLRRQFKALVRKGAGSNPAEAFFAIDLIIFCMKTLDDFVTKMKQFIMSEITIVV